MNKRQAIAYLERDGGYVPCSRWGRNSQECAPVAYDLARIYQECNGEPITADLLDAMMSAVVNDHDDVAELLIEHGTADMRERYVDELNDWVDERVSN